MTVIDSHIHCGVQNVDQPFEMIRPLLDNAGVQGCCLFPPEETFDRTIKFIEQVDGRTAVIIPHLGLLNGGFEKLTAAGVWEGSNVFADTALAGASEISGFLERYGSGRLLFGSDFPFGLPGPQLTRIMHMGIAADDLANICFNNISKLLKMGDNSW